MSGTRAAELRALHRPGDPLVVVNVWDAASARVVAATPGVRALATASWSIAAALGAPDGEHLTRDELLGAVRRIANATDLPVSADLERGYGDNPDEVAETIRLAVQAGAAGCNIEDSRADGLRALSEQVERVAAVRAADASIVINARTDALGHGLDLPVAIERGQAYLAAGADCIFVLGVTDLAAIRTLVAELGTVSLIGAPGRPSIEELADAGVARISFGPGAMGAAYAELARVARQLTARGKYPSTLSFRP